MDDLDNQGLSGWAGGGDYASVNDGLRSMARRMLRDHSAADDAVQKAWENSLRTAHGPKKNPGAWMRATVRNAARELHRDESRRRIREEVAARPEALPSAAEVASKNQIGAILAEAIDGLDKDLAQVLKMRYLEDMSYREVADELGRPLSTVRGQGRRGLEKLRERLESRFGSGRALGLALVQGFRWEEADLTGAASVASAGAAGAGSGTGAGLTLAPWLMGVAALLPLVAIGIWFAISGPGANPNTGPTGGALEEPSDSPELAVGPRVESPTGNSDSQNPAERLSIEGPGESVAETAAADTLPASGSGASEIAEASSLAVSAVNAAGQPIPGATVWISADPAGRGARPAGTTDADGSAILAVRADQAFEAGPGLGLDKMCYVHLTAPGCEVSRGILAPIGESRTPVAFKLRAGGTEVRGQVTDADGLPVPRAVILVGELDATQFEDEGKGEYWIAPRGIGSTDAKGQYVVHGAPASDMRVHVLAKGFPTMSDFSVAEDAERVERNFVLAPPATLRGVVHDAAGKPVEGAVIAPVGLEFKRRADLYAVTERDGTFELAGFGTATSTIQAYKESVGLDELVWKPKLGEERDHIFSLRIQRTLAIHVVDEKGRAVPQASVSVTGLARRPAYSQSLVCDAEGRAVAVGVPEGALSVTATISHPSTTYVGQKRVLETLPKEEYQFVLKDDRADRVTVRGTCSAPDGSVWPTGTHLLLSRSDRGVYAGEVDRDSGEFELVGLLEGSYELAMRHPSQGRAFLAAFEVKAGEDRELGALRPEPTGVIELDVDLGGDPSRYRYQMGHVILSDNGRPSYVFFRTGSGPVPKRVEAYPGTVILKIFEGDRVLASRSIQVWSGHVSPWRIVSDPWHTVSLELRFEGPSQGPPPGRALGARVWLIKDGSYVPPPNASFEDLLAFVSRQPVEEADTAIPQRHNPNGPAYAHIEVGHSSYLFVGAAFAPDGSIDALGCVALEFTKSLPLEPVIIDLLERP